MDTDDLARLWRSGGAFEPQMDEGRREEICAGWKKAIDRARNWATE